MKVLLVIITMLFMVENICHAEDCNFVKWPYSSALNEVEKIAPEQPLDNLRSYFLFQIIKGQNQELTQLLYNVLETKEDDIDFYNFAKLIAYSSDLHNDKFHALDAKEVCQIYKKVLATK